MRKLLVATRNKGKFLEIKKALENLPFEFLSLDGVEKIPKDFEVKEGGASFLENAVLKAKTFAEMSGLLTLADDSGLEVKALDGRPGVYSSRYAATDEERNKKLLGELKDIPKEKRDAQFRCLVAIFDPKTKKLETCEGICKGEIAQEPKGSYGFGYDPVFYLPKFDKTMAQLKTEEKNKISHRGRALKKARKILPQSRKIILRGYKKW